MRLIDTHNHLDWPAFDGDREQVLARARALGVARQVLIGVYQEQWQRLLQLALAEPGLYGALGLHPCYLAQHRSGAVEALRLRLEQLAGHAKLCAIGEVGLDYYIPQPDKNQQQALFEDQVQLAMAFELPLLLHVRRAHADVIATLKRYRPPRGGIVHAFSGSLEEAREYLRLGFLLGLGGAGTWPQAKRIQRVLRQLPLEAIVLETDAPDMPPSGYAGQRNSPELLPFICQTLAEIRGVTAEQLAAATSDNAQRLFGWTPCQPDSQ